MATGPADSALEDEFRHLVARGGAAMARGELEPAREALEDALAIRTRDPQVLGLLGQVFYRLGRYEAAATAWQRLVDDNPAEPGARVNLGLALLKAREYEAAIQQLRIALDLNPEHRKAAGYLGLALLELGRPDQAREWFVKAGSEQMVARCDALRSPAEEPPLDQTARIVLAEVPPAEVPRSEVELLEEPQAPPEDPEAGLEAPREPPGPPAPGPDPVAEPPPAPSLELPPEAGAEEPLPSQESVEALPPEVEPEAQPEAEPHPEPRPPPEAGAPAEPGPAPVAPAGLPTLVGFAAAREVQGPAGQAFVADGATLTVNVHGELLCRLAGLAAWRGELAFAGEVKRFRGQATDKPFGEPPDQMHRLVGDGLVVLRAAGRRFTVLELGGETGYFREAVVFGFQEQVAFENGRLPSVTGGLDLVHLRGRGRLVLVTRGEPVAVEVTEASPVHVPLSSLIGWTGALTPRIAPLFAGGAEGEAVEISGEGRVLVDPGPTGRHGDGS